MSKHRKLGRPEGCICDYGPNSDGPEETCPVHGRPYEALWAALENVAALCNTWDGYSKGPTPTTAAIREAIYRGWNIE